jgi:hypothetical protein
MDVQFDEDLQFLAAVRARYEEIGRISGHAEYHPVRVPLGTFVNSSELEA